MLPPDDRVDAPLEHQAHHIAGAIYGTILATAVVAAAAHDVTRVSQTFAVVAITSAVFWAAHVYSLSVAARIVVKRPLTWMEKQSIAVAEWPMLQSSWPILLALLLGSLGIIDKKTASYLAVIVGIGALFTYGVIMGRQEAVSWPKVLLNAVITAAFGIVILAMKVLVH